MHMSDTAIRVSSREDRRDERAEARFAAVQARLNNTAAVLWDEHYSNDDEGYWEAYPW